ncbi:MAG: CHAD domain-containing protein [Vicinamibacterales bacterium]
MPVSSPAARLLDPRLHALLHAVPEAQAGDVRAVHQARVASRRLREALPVAGAAARPAVLRRARRAVRRLTRALGPVRELDVALGHLDEVAGRGLVPAAALSRVRASLEQRRQARRGALLDALTPSRLEQLRRRIAALETSLPPAAEARRASRAAADTRVQRRGGRLAVAIERAGNVYLPDRLHRVRIAAKKLRYAVEVRQELVRSRATRRIGSLKRLQDLLGRLHDLEVLIDHVRDVQAEAAVGARGVTSGLDAVVRALEAECRELHGAYVADRDGWLRLAQAAAETP